MHTRVTKTYSAKLEESLPDNETQSRVKDAMVIGSVRSSLKEVSPTNTGCETTILEGGQPNISRLVTIRRVHQTRRAAKSVRSKASTPPAPGTNTSQRHKVCSQMADVIRRSGTGIERNVRWTSGNAPGTKDPTEVSQLSGNSVNAELAAKARVNAVRNSSHPLQPRVLIYVDMHRRLACERGSLIITQFISQGI
jgi:hypothetical protein